MSEDLSGRIIKSYELQELIGEGGFGAVYKAHQQFIGREVAIKVILPQYANKPDFIRRFETEAQLVARLEHPHIVPLYDYWREPSGAYLVMRWLRGGNMQESLENGGPWSPRRVQSMLTQIAEALAVAHRAGVIHRDLKPENIMLDDNGNAYLTDFGIAKDMGGEASITQKNAIVGSPAYLSPEQIQGRDVTPQSDIYALGLVLYELLTGERPFMDENPATLMYKHLAEPVPDLILDNDDVPPAINAVIQKATAKDPQMRYEDTITLARDFRIAVKSNNSDTDEFEIQAEGTAASTALITNSSIILPEPENPYKGLRAFQQADSQDFFGRDDLVTQILDRLDEASNISRFLAIVGPSGSGKSSVVKAGVLPALRDGAVEGSDDWFTIEMVPGIDPMEELEAALLRIAVNPPESLLSQLNEDSRGLLRAIKRVLPTDNSELLLFIDQFEELFTLVDEEDVRAHFMDSLIEAVTDPRSRLRVIITLRADFYDRPLNYNRFGMLMRARTEIVLPLSKEEIERAISGPSERVGMHVEPALLSAMVADVNDQPGALPLLQYALTELFERRDGHTLTLDAYQAIGGTSGALARRAEELYGSMTDEGQEAARQMFLRLVTLGEGAEDTRRRALQSELLSIGNDQEEMSLAIDAFGRYRLLTFDHDKQSRTATVEVAHEALIRQWKRLRGWLDESRSDLRTQRRINAAAREWINAKRDASFLARGFRLEQFESWANTTSLALNDIEADYVTASIDQRERLQEAEETRKQREEELEKRSQDRLRILVAVMSIAAVVGIALALFAFNESQEAARNEDQAVEARAEAETNAEEAVQARAEAEASAAEAQSLALAANARNALIQFDPTLGLALALEASQAFQPTTTEVLRVLASTAYDPGVSRRYEDHTASVIGAAISRDGSLSASGSYDGTIMIWANNSAERLTTITLNDGEFGAVLDFNADASILAAAIGGNDIVLYDVSSGDVIRTLTGHTGLVSSLEFSPAGDQLVSGSFDSTAHVWDVASGNVIQIFDDHTGVVLDVAFNRDGARVATTAGDATPNDTAEDEEDRLVRVFSVETGEVLNTFDLAAGYVRAVDFSPTAPFVAAGSWSTGVGGMIDVFDTQTNERVFRLFGHSDLILDIKFSPDGERIYSTSADNSVRTYEVASGLEVDRLETFSDRPLTIDLSDDGMFAVVGSGHIGNNLIADIREQSTTPSIWVLDLENRAEVNQFTQHSDWLWAVDVTSDGQLAASGSGPLRPPQADMDTSVRVWNVQTGEQLHRLTGHFSTVEGVEFSPDNQTLLTGGWDGQVILWDVASGEVISRFIDPTLNDNPEIELSPIIVIRDDAEVEITVEGRAMPDRILGVAFSPDGSRIATSSSAGRIALWDVETTELIRTFGNHESAVAGLSFSPDGSRIATGSWDATAHIYDVETGEEIQRFEGHLNRVNDVAFSPDGSRIITASWDATVRLWDAETGQELRQFVGHNGQVQTVAFNADGTLALSGSADTTMRLWEIETGQEFFRFANHTNWINEVLFMPGGTFALSAAQDETARLWRLPTNADEIISWAEENRYLRDLSCAEREQYRVEPFCEIENSVANAAE